jgi:transcriptional regulator with XRE-family HTH domain
MYFETLRGRLIERIRKRVQNGEVTERRLAGLSGISQPHIHNLLKGARALSPEIADRILRTLDMSVFDLLDPEEEPFPDSGPGPAGRWGSPESRGAPVRRQPRWLNRAAGTAPPPGRSQGPAWPSGTN